MCFGVCTQQRRDLVLRQLEQSTGVRVAEEKEKEKEDKKKLKSERRKARTVGVRLLRVDSCGGLFCVAVSIVCVWLRAETGQASG